MADLNFGGPAEDVDHHGPGGFAVLFNWLGALMSVALVVGMAWWGYRLAVRDVTGVPVIRALEGPMRVAPEDPGGETAAHQGLAVNDVAAEGSAARPADRLILAPKPLELAEEDLPRPRLAEAGTETAPPPVEAEEVVLLAAALAPNTPGSTLPGTGTGTPPAPEETAETPEETAPETRTIVPIPASIKGVKSSPFPRPRPEGDLTALAVASSVTLASAPKAIEVDPDTIVAGTRLVQFGAYDSAEAARSEWDKLEARFTDFLRGKQRVVQRAVSGGKTFYRLRAMGFADLADARRFCAALMADRQACIPVVSR